MTPKQQERRMDDLVKRGRFLAEMLETDKYEAHLDKVGWVTHQTVTAMADRIEALEALLRECKTRLEFSYSMPQDLLSKIDALLSPHQLNRSV